MAEGVDGLLRDKTRPPGVAPLAPAVVDKVVALTLEPPVIDRVRKIVIGDAELAIELTNGLILRRSLERVRHGNDARLVVGAQDALGKPKADPQLMILLNQAHQARALALARPKLTLDQLAAKFGRSIERYKRLLRLSYLSPTVVHAIVASQQPAHLNNRILQNLDGPPLSWAEQDQLLLG